MFTETIKIDLEHMTDMIVVYNHIATYMVIDNCKPKDMSR